MKKILTAVFIFFLALLFSPSAKATSGACSYHGGVNCEAGVDYDGSVICNDGWLNSSVNFNDVEECKNIDYCAYLLNNAPSEYERIKIKNGAQYLDENFNNLKSDGDKTQNEINEISNEISTIDFNYKIAEQNLKDEYYKYKEDVSSRTIVMADIEQALNAKSEKINLEINKTYSSYIRSRAEKELSLTQKRAYLNDIKSQLSTLIEKLKAFDFECQNIGYIKFYKKELEKTKKNNIQSEPIKNQSLELNSSPEIATKNTSQFLKTEKELFKKADDKLVNKLRGKILLQVESKGEAWYINPKDGKKYYMADGNEAYRIMRFLGVGITNKDLEKIKTDKIFAKKHSGKIFLQVENNGEAYYIDFEGNDHYLKNGESAYEAMRNLGLGITNIDLRKIEINEI